jgi:hypothetical protein
MHYPYWSASESITLTAWLRAGQLCLCSEDPNQSKSRVGIDCWLGDRWATNRDWALVLQIPPLQDKAWHRNVLSCPQDTRRPVVLAVQDPRYGGFRVGKCLPDQPGRWLMYTAGEWEGVHTEAILGWLEIPHRLRRERRRPLSVLRRKLKIGRAEPNSELFI